MLRLFVRLVLFDEDQAAGMLTWAHSGFHRHTTVWVPEDDRAIVEAAARVGIAARLDHRADTLSGGERRRVELAAVLVGCPTCFLADDPGRGLAPHDADVFTTALRVLAGTGVAVLVTGHEVATLLNAADHIT